ncbi:hypothetical protein TBLA_0C02750 [Henningerozyma blattae CBS 6284]|uniref:SCP domain-containing protein n=1 Tax=Henningerozyma blattae (strain ATCC 34711 / CBS 6284 / DSM 70876 / NBRC 10599 / NRRL Y-10934 / UCD 77-7) TaxID=1071380 RepID=I2H131_HENB6|nr:hypothetical protein TBLA_0C02750 [Tetrapisispora blattae CBS 6284]CCH60083.1 hypothetical protein TBLA_0C02750 [Tetrapisispora blattae CBS 6284]
MHLHIIKFWKLMILQTTGYAPWYDTPRRYHRATTALSQHNHSTTTAHSAQTRHLQRHVCRSHPISLNFAHIRTRHCKGQWKYEVQTLFRSSHWQDHPERPAPLNKPAGIILNYLEYSSRTFCVCTGTLPQRLHPDTTQTPHRHHCTRTPHIPGARAAPNSLRTTPPAPFLFARPFALCVLHSVLRSFLFRVCPVACDSFSAILRSCDRCNPAPSSWSSWSSAPSSCPSAIRTDAGAAADLPPDPPAEMRNQTQGGRLHCIDDCIALHCICICIAFATIQASMLAHSRVASISYIRATVFVFLCISALVIIVILALFLFCFVPPPTRANTPPPLPSSFPHAMQSSLLLLAASAIATASAQQVVIQGEVCVEDGVTTSVLSTVGGSATTIVQGTRTSSVVPNYPTQPVADLSSWEQEVLSESNKKRALHADTPALSWAPELAAYAQAFADQYVCGSALSHSSGEWGENIALGYSPTGSVDAWYNEINDYDFQDPAFAPNTGHFTQLVWKATTQVGCGRKDCGDYYKNYIVCEYSAPGNFDGEFADNVKALI